MARRWGGRACPALDAGDGGSQPAAFGSPQSCPGRTEAHVHPPTGHAAAADEPRGRRLRGDPPAGTGRGGRTRGRHPGLAQRGVSRWSPPPRRSPLRLEPPACTVRPIGGTATGTAKVATPPARPAASPRGPRRARLAIKRIDPWSVMKFSFAVSLVLFIVVIVAASVLYLALDSMGVFASVNSTLADLLGVGRRQRGRFPDHRPVRHRHFGPVRGDQRGAFHRAGDSQRVHLQRLCRPGRGSGGHPGRAGLTPTRTTTPVAARAARHPRGGASGGRPGRWGVVRLGFWRPVR